MKFYRNLCAGVLVGVWVLVANSALAQEYPIKFKHISYQEGLSQSPIVSLFQDKKGLIWIGNREGLLSCDGYEFKTYAHKDEDSHSLSNNQVRTILQDHLGKLWIGTANGLNRCSTERASPQKLGPTYSLARKITDYINKPIGIISNSKGGTSINRWQKGYNGAQDNDLYEHAVARAKAALAATTGATIKAIIWHQGESNNDSPAIYMPLLQQLVKDLRTDLGNKKLPFIAGEVGTWNGRGAGVNPVIRSIKEQILYSDYVTSAGLTSIDLKHNNPHFDNHSQRVLGGRYADKVLGMIYKIDVGGVTLYNENNYSGRSVVLKPGKYDAKFLEAYGILAKDINSIAINKEYMVSLYTGDAKPVKLSKSEAVFKQEDISVIVISSK